MTMASLSASLLARKGHASPAARPDGSMPPMAKVQEMFPAKRPQLAPRPASAVPQAAPQKAAPAISQAAPKGTDTRTRKTLRLETDKSRQLRLLAAHLGVSQQSLMEKAVTALLSKEMGEGCCLCGTSKKPEA